jgi:hypothetical protein
VKKPSPINLTQGKTEPPLDYINRLLVCALEVVEYALDSATYDHVLGVDMKLADQVSGRALGLVRKIHKQQNAGRPPPRSRSVTTDYLPDYDGWVIKTSFNRNQRCKRPRCWNHWYFGDLFAWRPSDQFHLCLYCLDDLDDGKFSLDDEIAAMKGNPPPPTAQ